MSNLNRVRLSCCWVGVGLGCDNIIDNEAGVVTRSFAPPVLECRCGVCISRKMTDSSL